LIPRFSNSPPPAPRAQKALPFVNSSREAMARAVKAGCPTYGSVIMGPMLIFSVFQAADVRTTYASCSPSPLWSAHPYHSYPRSSADFATCCDLSYRIDGSHSRAQAHPIVQAKASSDFGALSLLDLNLYDIFSFFLIIAYNLAAILPFSVTAYPLK